MDIEVKATRDKNGYDVSILVNGYSVAVYYQQDGFEFTYGNLLEPIERIILNKIKDEKAKAAERYVKEQEEKKHCCCKCCKCKESE